MSPTVDWPYRRSSGRQKDAARAPSVRCRGEIGVGSEVVNSTEAKGRSAWRQRIPMKRPSIASECSKSAIDDHRSVYFATITLPFRQRLETGKPLDFSSKWMGKVRKLSHSYGHLDARPSTCRPITNLFKIASKTFATTFVTKITMETSAAHSTSIWVSKSLIKSASGI